MLKTDNCYIWIIECSIYLARVVLTSHCQLLKIIHICFLDVTGNLLLGFSPYILTCITCAAYRIQLLIIFCCFSSVYFLLILIVGMSKMVISPAKIRYLVGFLYALHKSLSYSLSGVNIHYKYPRRSITLKNIRNM